jgi:hypothetical protein
MVHCSHSVDCKQLFASCNLRLLTFELDKRELAARIISETPEIQSKHLGEGVQPVHKWELQENPSQQLLREGCQHC